MLQITLLTFILNFFYSFWKALDHWRYFLHFLLTNLCTKMTKEFLLTTYEETCISIKPNDSSSECDLGFGNHQFEKKKINFLAMLQLQIDFQVKKRADRKNFVIRFWERNTTRTTYVDYRKRDEVVQVTLTTW